MTRHLTLREQLMLAAAIPLSWGFGIGQLFSLGIDVAVYKKLSLEHVWIALWCCGIAALLMWFRRRHRSVGTETLAEESLRVHELKLRLADYADAKESVARFERFVADLERWQKAGGSGDLPQWTPRERN